MTLTYSCHYNVDEGWIFYETSTKCNLHLSLQRNPLVMLEQNLLWLWEHRHCGPCGSLTLWRTLRTRHSSPQPDWTRAVWAMVETAACTAAESFLCSVVLPTTTIGRLALFRVCSKNYQNLVIRWQNVCLIKNKSMPLLGSPSSLLVMEEFCLPYRKDETHQLFSSAHL